MDVKKMKVSNIHSVKLTKRGDNLMGSMSHCRNYVAKHNDVIVDVLLAGTNDLSNKHSCPEDLINDLDSALTDLTHFSKVQHVFICKIPAHLDFITSTTKSASLTVCYQNVSLRNIFPWLTRSFLKFVIIMSTVFTLVVLASRKFAALFYPICVKFLPHLSIRNVRVPALLMLKVIADTM